jgi:surface antigen
MPVPLIAGAALNVGMSIFRKYPWLVPVAVVLSLFPAFIIVGAVAASGETIQAIGAGHTTCTQSTSTNVFPTTFTSKDVAEADLQESCGAGGGGGATAGDDYPWSNVPFNKSTGYSPLGYGYRQCVDFVAWKLNEDAGATSAPWKYKWGSLTPYGGNAEDWLTSWQNLHRTYSKTPIVGSVAYWGHSGGSLGHVAYVTSVNPDNTVTIEEYNWGDTGQYDQRVIPIGNPDMYLYPPSD